MLNKIFTSVVLSLAVCLASCASKMDSSNQLDGRQSSNISDEAELPILDEAPLQIEEHYSVSPHDTDVIVTSMADTHDLIWAKAEFDKYGINPGVIYPISHIFTNFISPIGSCVFLLRGFYGAEIKNENNPYPARYIMVNSIEIMTENGKYYQLIDGLSTRLKPYYENYGLIFGDWNGDGAMDIQLRQFEGGTMHNEPSLFWLWDYEQSIFVENGELREISNYSRIYLELEKDRRLRSFTRVSSGEYRTLYYDFKNGEFVCVEMEYVYFELQNDMYYKVTQISRLINDEMKIVEEIRVKREE